MKKNFSFSAKIWKWTGDSPWHFVNVPKDISDFVKLHGVKFGAGMVRVEIKVGKSVWQGALFPHKKSGIYILAVKKIIRKNENLFEGDEVKVNFRLV